MDTRDTIADLRRLPHFRGLPDDLLEGVASASRSVRFDAGLTIFAEGDPVRGFWAVRSGMVKVYRLSIDGHEQVLHHLGQGRTFAEAAVLSMSHYPAHAVAVADTELIEIAAEPFLRLFRGEPRLAAAMVSALSNWLLDLTDRVENLSIASASVRLAHFLLRLPSRRADGVTVLELPFAKKELAAYVATTPETLSRLLRRWQEADVLRSAGRRLEILDERVLSAIADGGENAEVRRAGRAP